jgi:hypothetical protein
MDIQTKKERVKLMNLYSQHYRVLNKLDNLCKELSDMDVKEFLEVYENLRQQRNKVFDVRYDKDYIKITTPEQV